MATAATTLFSLTKLKDHLGIAPAVTTDDTDLERIADGVTQHIETFTGRFFVSREVVETRNGDGRRTLKLRHYPVVDVELIRVRADMLSSWIELEAADFEVDLFTGYVYLASGTVANFYKGHRTVEVTYNAGYGAQDAATLPQDIILTAFDYTKFCYDRLKAGGLMAGNITLGPTSVSVVPDMPKDLKDRLERYRKVRL